MRRHLFLTLFLSFATLAAVHAGERRQTEHVEHRRGVGILEAFAECVGNLFGVRDADAVAAIADKEGDLAAERIKLTGEALSQVLAMLTDEQRAQLDTMAAERQKRRGEKRQNRVGSP